MHSGEARTEGVLWLGLGQSRAGWLDGSVVPTPTIRFVNPGRGAIEAIARVEIPIEWGGGSEHSESEVALNQPEDECSMWSR